jgi:hypothetical protein
MSEVGQTRTSAGATAMSAVPPITDINDRRINVGFVPISRNSTGLFFVGVSSTSFFCSNAAMEPRLLMTR